jgi:hypothetical protein
LRNARHGNGNRQSGRKVLWSLRSLAKAAREIDSASWTSQRPAEPPDGVRMVRGFLDLIKAIVLHAPLFDRLDYTEISFGTAGRGAEGLLPGVDVVQSGKLEPRVAPTDIAAQPHLPVGLSKCAEGEGLGGPG